MFSMRFILAAMVLGLCAPAWVQAEVALPVFKGIRVFRSGDGLGVEISADKNFEYTCSKMPQLLKVVVDLPRTELGKPDTVYKYKSAMISSIWLEKKTINGVMITRVSVNLTEDADFTARTDPSDSKKMTVFLRKLAPGSNTAAAVTMPGDTGREQQPAVGKPSAPVAPASKVVLSPVVPVNKQPITVTGVHCGADTIEIKSGGNISEFKAFTLQQPGRLVIDIPGAQTALSSIAVPANRFGVLKARIGIFEGRLRLVFDTGKKPFPDYDVVKTGAGLKVVLRASAAGKK
jgi:type IV pilus assembly protein PilQ